MFQSLLLVSFSGAFAATRFALCEQGTLCTAAEAPTLALFAGMLCAVGMILRGRKIR